MQHFADLIVTIPRYTLSRAIRTPDTNRRRRRLGTAALLGLVCVASIVSFSQAISDDHISGASLLLHNAIGVPAMVGAVVFLIAGLLTPRTSNHRPFTPMA